MVPEDDVLTADGKIMWLGCLAEESAMAVGREEVEVFINVVESLILVGKAVEWLGSPDLRWNIDEEAGNWPRNGWVEHYGAG